jgi:plasmid stabilization system protein ParE
VIRLSQKAREQIASLAEHYDALDRPGAVRNLRAAITQAGLRIEAQQGLFFPAPRPYPGLIRAGWIWLKEGPYWIAYTMEPDGAVIQVVFYETADITGRLGETGDQ